MAEGGSESLRNNLCRNQEKKMVEEKSISQQSGFPELPVMEGRNLSYQGLANGRSFPTLTPVHQHSNHSETALKDILENAPLLTPTESEMNCNNSADQLPRPSSSVKISNVDVASVTSDSGPVLGDQSLPFGASKGSNQEEPGRGSETYSSSIASSYLQAAFANPSSLDPQSPCSVPNSSFFSPQDGEKSSTNDLSASRPDPLPPTFPVTMDPPFPNTMGGVMPMMVYSIPVGYAHPGQPAMSPLFASVGNPVFYPMAQTMGQNASQYMMPNISFGPQGMSRMNGAAGETLTRARFGEYTNQQTLDSRNIPVNGTGPSAPYSQENNSEGSRSCSINPGSNTRLTRLREPVLKWIKKKLDNPCTNNWEAVADIRGWNYEDIRDHLIDCRHNRESPFLKLLETEKFHTYTVQDFLEDMARIGRKDILMDFDDILQNNKS